MADKTKTRKLTKAKILSDIKQYMKTWLEPDEKQPIKAELAKIKKAIEANDPRQSAVQTKAHAKIESILRLNISLLLRPIPVSKGLQSLAAQTQQPPCQFTKACKITGLIPLYPGYSCSTYRVKLSSKAYRDTDHTFDYVPLDKLSPEVRDQIWHDLFDFGGLAMAWPFVLKL